MTPLRSAMLGIALLALVGCAKRPDENVFAEVAHYLAKSNDGVTSPIALEASLKRTDKSLFLNFRLKNISANPIQMYPTELPWGNANSLSIAALTINGIPLDNSYMIDDPVPVDTITIAPGAELRGDYDLWARLTVDRLPTDDVLILWAYNLPMEGGRRFAASTGVALLKATDRPLPNKSLERSRDK